MSLFSDIRRFAEELQNPIPEGNQSSYQDARWDISDALHDILSRYPQDTGHEWKWQLVQWDEDSPVVSREICALCGLDRMLGDESVKCDNARPTDEEKEKD